MNTVFIINPATSPKNGLNLALTSIVAPITIPQGVKPKGPETASGTELIAPNIFVEKVTKVPRINKKPAIVDLCTYLPIFGKNLRNKIIAINVIIITDAKTGCGAVAVPEIIASTGPPPNKEDPMSARLEYIAK